MNVRNTTSAVSVALTLLLAAGALTCLGLMVGDGTLQWPWGLTSDPITAEIIWQIRAPRSIGAWAAGALLGLAGAIAQAIFRNPLADPYLLGSSSGAALAVAIALALASWLGADVSGAAFWGGFMAFGLTGAAFTGALLAVILTVTLAGGVAQGTRLLLGGVVVGVVLGALTSFLTFIAPNVLLNMQGFMLGSTALLNWSAVGRLLVVGAICMAIAATCRGANSNKDSIGCGNRRAKIKIKMQPSSLDIASNKLGQTGLVNRHITLIDFLNFRRIFIDASDIKSEFRKTCPRDETYISSANDRNFHNIDSHDHPMV